MRHNCSIASFFVFRLGGPPSCPLFPYTTLFRSEPSVSTSIPLTLTVLSPGVSTARVSSSGVWSAQSTPPDRSEEHTSELQSRGHLVCRLLLEKKNTPTSLDSPVARYDKECQWTT